MLRTRWKVMAGMFGVSVASLAAVSGQTPVKKPADAQRAAAVVPPSFVEPPLILPVGAVVPANAPPAVVPLNLVVPATPPDCPPLPGAVEPVKLPTAAKVPDLVVPPPAYEPVKVETVAPVAPLAPPADFQMVVPSKPVAPVSVPAEVKPVMAVTPAAPPVVADVTPAPKAVPVETVTKVASKYKIMMIVGEGEPSFEVRNGDDLLLKAVCEKVDVKSPEKGKGLSAVTAAGKVRFVGFGSEGTCDELSFLAGTGEVQLCGAVKIQVKDKLGRVETELSGEKMQYRLRPDRRPAGRDARQVNRVG